jgi:hypothetical protein
LLVDWLQSWHERVTDVRDYWTRVALICWCLWRHQNDIVFEGATLSPHAVSRTIRREDELWKVAGLFKAELDLVDRWMLGE